MCIRCAQRYIDYVQGTTKQRTYFFSEVRRSGSMITMFTETHLQRMIVTVTVILALMLVGPEHASIALTCCSTHPLENLFGLTRIACRFEHTYPNIREATARAQFIKDVHHELNLPISINKRVNIAGQKIVHQFDYRVDDEELLSLPRDNICCSTVLHARVLARKLKRGACIVVCRLSFQSIRLYRKLDFLDFRR